MNAGSVLVADDETATGEGMAFDIYTADVLTLVLPTVPGPLGDTTPPYSTDHPVDAADITAVQKARLAVLREHGRMATAIAAGVVTHLAAHATAHVTTQVLGRTPNPNNADTAIQAPSAPVDIPIT